MKKLKVIKRVFIIYFYLDLISFWNLFDIWVLKLLFFLKIKNIVNFFFLVIVNVFFVLSINKFVDKLLVVIVVGVRIVIEVRLWLIGLSFVGLIIWDIWLLFLFLK